MNILPLQDLPIEAKFNLLTYFSGVEISKFREISKHMKNVVDEIESQIYDVRMQIEYPKRFVSYKRVCNYRTDWKNIYIICDQFRVAKSRTERHRQILINRENYLIFEKVSIIAELVIGLVSGAVSIAKVCSLGWASSRLLIRQFLENNPGKTVQEALKALGLLKEIPQIPDIGFL